MISALVTGASGFSGRALVAHLHEQQVAVHALSTRAARQHGDTVDFGDAQSVARFISRTRPTRILHLSGALNAPDLASMVTANILDAAVLLDAVKMSGIDTRVLIVGSAAEYGAIDAADLPASEDLPPRPFSPYGCTKLAQTQIALASGIPVVVVRPSNIIGPGMPRELALGRFAAELGSIVRGEKEPVLHVGGLSAIRDMIDVRDAVRIYWELLNRSEAEGKVVNVATGFGLSMAEALAGLIQAFDAEVRVVDDNVGSARSGGSSTFIASRQRLEALIGQQRFIPVAQTLERIAAHARSAGA